jgi:flavin-dependent dehydrogenase
MHSGAIWDAAVVGAGPAGSATAALLAGRGFKVLLLDRSAFPRPKPCAEYLGPGALAILARLGLELESAAAGCRIAGMRIVAPDGTAFEGRFHRAEWGIGMRRELLDTALVELAARRGACVVERVTVADLSYENRAVILEARTADHRPLRFKARLLVGADGLHSRIARRLGLALRSRLPRLALVSHSPDLELDRDLAEIHIGPGGYLGLAPVGGGLVNVAVVTRARRPAGLPLRDWFGTMLDQYPQVARRWGQIRSVELPLAAGPFGYRCRSPVAHRAVLVGDAAEFYDPLTGDGIYAALRGAELIDRHVARRLERDALTARQLAAYRRARDRAFAAKRIAERIIGAVAAGPSFPVFARLLKRHPAAANFLVRLTGHGSFVGFPRARLRQSSFRPPFDRTGLPIRDHASAAAQREPLSGIPNLGNRG